MPEPLAAALDRLRPLLAPGELVRAVASGRRRGAVPAYSRAELRTVRRDGGVTVQSILTSAGGAPVTSNLSGDDVPVAVDALLAEPFGSWHVRTRSETVQLRVTKRGEAQVHIALALADDVQPGGHDREPQHLMEPADPLFTVVGADAAKRRQVDAFLRQLEPGVRRLDAPGRPLRMVDLGCGNAYLTTAAHRYLTSTGHPVETIGIDVRPEMASRNSAVAERLGLQGIAFVAGSIAASAGLDSPDLVLALHACDTATDDALALAVRHGAKAILAAPCCHHDVQRQLDRLRADGEIPHPYAALTRQPILRERFADVLTDALRADLLRLLGYRVDVVEFVDSRHTPRNAMIRAVFTGAAPTPRRVEEYRDLVTAWHVRPALAERLAPELEPLLS